MTQEGEKIRKAEGRKEEEHRRDTEDRDVLSLAAATHPLYRLTMKIMNGGNFIQAARFSIAG